VLVSAGWGKRKIGFDTPDPAAKKPGQVWAMCSMENGVTYPRDNKPETIKALGMDFVMTTVDAHPTDIPITMFSHFFLGKSVQSTLRSPKPMTSKKPRMALIQAACMNSKFDYRTTWIESLIAADKKVNPKTSMVASMGHCWHNENAQVPWEDDGMGNRPMAFHLNKMSNIRSYMFTLCHESIERDDWVTEKVYHALAVGSVPVYRGSKNIANYLPCKNCIINANDFATPEQLLAKLEFYVKNPIEYNKLLAWKNEPYDAKAFPAFEKVRANSVDTGICRLASKASANEFRHKASAECTGDCLKEIQALQLLSPHG